MALFHNFRILIWNAQSKHLFIILGKGGNGGRCHRDLCAATVCGSSHHGGHRRRDTSGGVHHRGHPSAGHGESQTQAAAPERHPPHRSQLPRSHQRKPNTQPCIRGLKVQNIFSWMQKYFISNMLSCKKANLRPYGSIFRVLNQFLFCHVSKGKCLRILFIFISVLEQWEVFTAEKVQSVCGEKSCNYRGKIMFGFELKFETIEATFPVI